MAGNDTNTIALWHFDGADGAQSGDGFADDSVGGSTHNLTAQGDAQIDTGQSKFGGSSLLLDGTGDYASCTDSSDFNIAAQDFGFDAQIRPSITANEKIAGQYDTASQRSWQLSVHDASTVRVILSNNGDDTDILDWSTSVSTDNWHHIALMKSGTSIDLWLNGVHQGTKSTSYGTLYNSTAPLTIGCVLQSGSPNNEFHGHIDEARLVVGIRPMDNPRDPLYISSGNPADGFTVPALAYSPPSVATLTLARNYRAHARADISLARDHSRDHGLARLSLARDFVRDRGVFQLALSRSTRGHITGELDISARKRGHVIGELDISARKRGHVVGELDLSARKRGHVVASLGLQKRLFAHVMQELALNRDTFARKGWAIYATDTATDTTTYLGFVKNDASPLILGGISLADGTWDIEARPWGNYWRDTRSATRLRVVISGGEILSGANDLPDVAQLRASDISAWGRTISWTWQDGYRVTTPEDFGLWFGATSPVDTSGDPDATINARPADRNHTYRYDQTAAAVVAIAARDDSENQGPVSELALDWVSGTLSDPDPQWAVKGN